MGLDAPGSWMKGKSKPQLQFNAVLADPAAVPGAGSSSTSNGSLQNPAHRGLQLGQALWEHPMDCRDREWGPLEAQNSKIERRHLLNNLNVSALRL